MATTQQHLIDAHGKRFARIIADAQPGDVITGSLAWHHATQDEIERWMGQGLIGRNGSDYVAGKVGV